jgi:excisionase family DNA binding protein
MSAIESLTMSPRQAAAFLGIGKTKLIELVRTGRIKAKSLDGRIRVSTDSLAEFHAGLPDYTPPEPKEAEPTPRRRHRVVRH